MADSADFDAMEAVFRETERGRRFLDEVARRARLTETDTLLDALGRIERAMSPRGVRAAETRPARSSFPGLPAAAAILDAAERIQETAWTMREAGAEPGLCDRLDGAAADIHAACTTLGHEAAQTGPASLFDAEHAPGDARPEELPPTPAGMTLADLARVLAEPDARSALEKLRLLP